MIIGFVGAGRVGCSIGKYLAEAGEKISGYYDLSKDAAQSAASFTASGNFDNLQAFIAQSSLIFLTTPDGIIQETWEQLRQYPLSDKVICHCSGAMTSAVFTGIEEAHAFGCSLHPMLPFHSRFSSYEMLKHAFYTIEGHPYATAEVSGLFAKHGGTVCQISGECKPKYHAAASILSNQVTAVLDTGYRLLEECGFERKDAIEATWQLVSQNLENIRKNDCIQSLTGPIERNDIGTVQKHLDCLNEDDRNMYRILGWKLTQISEKKNPSTDYSSLKSLLKRKE